jgi:hypothetical protein
MWCASEGVRPQTTLGCVATNLQCSYVAQANGFRRNATVTNDCRYGGRRLGTAEGLALLLRAFGA